jgi:hypothetical protein
MLGVLSPSLRVAGKRDICDSFPMGSSRFVGVLALILLACGPSTTPEELCARFGLVPDPARDACRCPDGTTRREDGTGCDLADGGFLPFPDAGVFDAGSDAAIPLDAGSDAGDASSDDAGDCERCDGTTCVDVSSNPSNCGACGQRCAEGWECQASECVDVPVALTAGAFTTCARMGSGDVYCWGSNVAGVAGVDSTEANLFEPRKVVGIDRAADVDTSGHHTCAAESTGLVYCWGENSSGEASSVEATEIRAPRRILGVTDAIRVAVGTDHSCALRETGAIVCWGSNSSGQLGVGDVAPHEGVQDVEVEDGVEIDAGGATTCASTSSGELRCWGGLRPDGMTGVASTPVAAIGLPAVGPLAGGEINFCAGGAAGGTYCWGVRGAVITTSEAPFSVTNVPTLIPESTSSVARSLAVDGQLYRFADPITFHQHSCFTTGDGTLSCWGTNTAGQLGRGSLDSQPFPVSLEFEPVDEVVVGHGHTCTRVERGRVACWGRGEALGLGEADTTDQRTPVVLSFFPVR